MAYVSQEAWLRNDTLEKNIYFGGKSRRDRYEQVLDVCALRPDIDMLPAGDQTEIGEKVRKKNLPTYVCPLTKDHFLFHSILAQPKGQGINSTSHWPALYLIGSYCIHAQTAVPQYVIPITLTVMVTVVCDSDFPPPGYQPEWWPEAAHLIGSRCLCRQRHLFNGRSSVGRRFPRRQTYIQPGRRTGGDAEK